MPRRQKSLLRLGLADVVRHLERYLDRVLDEAAEGAVLLPPGGLIDELLQSCGRGC